MPYKTVNNLISFTAMWYKINELSRKNLTQVQIAALLDVNRSTVRRYQMMSEAEFKERVQGIQLQRKHKLDSYRGFITKDLQDAPYLSCAQVKDHLLENFPDMPYVSDRTVYNYVMRVREEEDIPVMSSRCARCTSCRNASMGSRHRLTMVRNGCAHQAATVSRCMPSSWC